MKKTHFILLFILLTLFSCRTEDNFTLNTVDPTDEVDENDDDDNEEMGQSVRILSLGNSYTIGTGVCPTCSYPEQLKDSLVLQLNSAALTIDLDVIATAGWTTTSLLNAINAINPPTNFDLSTLLIGVNNQFQGLPFSIFETEFVQLVEIAIAKAGNDPSNLIVLSIPDYAYTPFGQSFGNPETTSEEIDLYNAYIENYCMENNITFLNVTDISREGIENPEIVAGDGLHLSELAYSIITQRLVPLALEKIN